MEGPQLKRWRENRELTQDELAGHLGWTRQKLANVESDRTSLKEDIEPLLAAIDRLLGLDKPPAPKRVEPRCWDIAGNAITLSHVEERPFGFPFYREEGRRNRGEDGHLLAGFYITSRRWPRGETTYLQLDLETWKPRAVAWHDHPKHVEMLAKLDAALEAKRNAPQSAGMFQQ